MDTCLVHTQRLTTDHTPFGLQTFVQNKAKEVLMSATLDVYSSLPVRGAPAAGRTLLDQVMVSENFAKLSVSYLV
jgi:hypothetical protein